MDFELKAGAKLSLLSDDEERHEFEHLRRTIAASGLPPTTELVNDVVTTDGGGNLSGVPLYTVPTGRTALLHRIQVWDGQHFPSAPLAAGWWALFRNAVQNSGLVVFPTGASVIPFWEADGRENAAQFRNGERIVIAGAALPAGLSIGISLQVGLYETARGSRGDQPDPHATERGAPVVIR